MRMLIFISTIVLLMLACNTNHNTGDLKLNNGEKWKVNAEMKPHIERGNKILDDYLVQQSANWRELAEKLKSENENLIKSCTMKGQSHDELHKWLHPHMELIDKLSTATNLMEAETLIAQIGQSFKTYQTYFE
ncbi:MAG: hypothetical protein IPH12_08595 [Saprospirales bacterium]|nr:hypothetical protein [Saprospirales bacterium]MBK8920897.1 hypothetical protein [Saprospirales bacterium]